jgi:hypothetical protein
MLSQENRLRIFGLFFRPILSQQFDEIDNKKD